ncbi:MULTISPECIES: hypothetical protein [Chryseobacterium]|uniref:Lipoprotein n=1 Tax=Chryseobacterium camelliae TaxID=1265445 RepID=A0ABU0TIV3_9FLAO|nr:MULTISPECIES: hypothetical protein [Chryseobacterium]MDT3409217.1 hypothetical protein [Pseudacidovorax intermedius]MDQ1096921.1 hypothetical protein [Chryseobacterium camelliae]MDQ1100863.1 hypothetical protein [Chryseobacterium sp. SORGH_AS_1048]MDR6084305.1 hypothetical protein [Chryseobacterium sp. SORGH_AS_0909]MDR6132576.1 hypothetical protein [Chryseobacterium sp. SORGH_AS_1175]
MTIKIKFKKSEIFANLLLNFAGLCIGCIMIFHNHTVASGKSLMIKVIVFAALTALIFNLLVYMRRFIKSLNNVAALEIDDSGICSNISKQKSLGWNEISYCTIKSVQMSSGRHSKILVYSYDPSLSMTIDTDVLDIDKNELLDILNQKNDLNR